MLFNQLYVYRYSNMHVYSLAKMILLDSIYLLKFLSSCFCSIICTLAYMGKHFTCMYIDSQTVCLSCAKLQSNIDISKHTCLENHGPVYPMLLSSNVYKVSFLKYFIHFHTLLSIFIVSTWT